MRLIRHRTKPALPLLCACLALVLTCCVRGADAGLDGFLPTLDSFEDEPITVDAQNLSYNASNGWYEAHGNVTVTCGDQVLHADHVRVHAATKQAEASGSIVLDRGPRGTWRGETLSYNFGTGEGISSENVVDAGPYHVRAERARRDAGELIYMERAALTTCTNAVGHEHYLVRGRFLELKPNDYVKIRGATLRLFGIPIFYFPYWRRNLDRHYGLHVTPGYSSRMGAFLLSTYTVPIMDTGPGVRADSRTRVDVRTERGVGLGQELIWENTSIGTGLASVYYLDDQDPVDDDDPLTDEIDRSRYRLHVSETLDLTPADRLLIQATYLSDADVEEDFFEDAFHRQRQPDNFISYTHSAADYQAGGIARFGVNDFYDHVERLPELWFDMMRRELGQTGVYYDGRNRIAFLNRRWATYRETEQDYDALRLDTDHLVLYPTKQFGFLSVVPRAGTRLTYYSDTLRHVVESQVTEQTETNAVGEVVTTTVPTVNEYDEPDGAGLRGLMELGVEVSFKAYGLFGAGDSAWRHVIEPYTDYTLVPQPNLRPGELYQFDDVDRLDKEHTIKLGVRNQIQVKRGGRNINAVDLDLYTIYDLDPDPDEAALDLVYLDGRYRPWNWLQLYTDGIYSLDESQVQQFDTRVNAWQSPVWTFSGEHLYRRDLNNLVLGSVTYAPSRMVAFNLYSRYEFEDSRLEEQGGYVQYSLDCIAFRLGGSFVPGYTTSAGVERDDEFRATFTAWLTAFPPDNLSHRYLH